MKTLNFISAKIVITIKDVSVVNKVNTGNDHSCRVKFNFKTGRNKVNRGKKIYPNKIRENVTEFQMATMKDTRFCGI